MEFKTFRISIDKFHNKKEIQNNTKDAKTKITNK